MISLVPYLFMQWNYTFPGIGGRREEPEITLRHYRRLFKDEYINIMSS
jgi:hypothetical protein